MTWFIAFAGRWAKENGKRLAAMHPNGVDIRLVALLLRTGWVSFCK
jgi:hypothetical protein